MRIEIKASAKRHLITGDEIRAVLSNYEVRISVEPRDPSIEADDYFYAGRAAANEPHIEVVADHVDPAVVVVFHAMMLRPSQVRELGLERFITPEYGPQRA